MPGLDGWRRTDPDFRLYVPSGFDTPDAQNQQLIVRPTPSGTFVAVWTIASQEGEDDQRIASARSTDGGETWSDPTVVDEPSPDNEPGAGLASWAFPIVAPDGGPSDDHRIHCFYNKNVGPNDVREDTTGVLRCRWSDDDGRAWSDETVDFDIDPCAISHPDPDVPENWIVCFQPTWLDDSTVLAGFTHWASDTVDDAHLFERQSEVRFLRFEDLNADAVDDIAVTTWPDSPHGLQIPHPDRPGISVAQEPRAVRLPDGRLLCTMRTYQGTVHFALSDNDGETWDTPRPLHYEPDERRPVENPVAPAPLYRLADGRYLLVFYNNDGTGHGGKGPVDTDRNRTPAWYAIGEYVDDPAHPLRFDGPRILVDNDREALPAAHNTYQTATYPSFFEHDGRAYFWYPDGKHFLLGKDLTDELKPA